MPSKPTSDLRQLGAMLLLGVIAGYGARQIIARANRATSRQPARLIDWDQARLIALRMSQWEQAPINDRTQRRAQYTDLVQRSEPLIARYLGVDLPQPISQIHVMDRRDWLLANFDSFQKLFAPIEELYTRSSSNRGEVGAVLGALNSRFMGLQMGLLLGFLARRVLGQYDLSLLSPDPLVRGSLYFVEPNIARVQRQLGLHDHDFRLWIVLHEATHVFEFEAYPWVRAYFNDLLRQFLSQVSDQLAGLGLGLADLVGRLLQGRESGRHWIEQMLTDEQRRVFDRMQALMSLVEGYSNHIMNAIGAQLLPSFHQIEARVRQRQQNKTLLEELFNRVTGMDLKLAQYQQGEAFVNAVVQARGVAFMHRVWEREEHLPTMDEIRNPARWIARIDSIGS